MRRLRQALCAGAAVLVVGTLTMPADAAKPPPASSTSKACGGKASVTVSGTTWRCVFSDDFSGTTVDATKWQVVRTAANGFHSGLECYVDNPANVAVSDGSLRLTARTVPWFACGVTGYTYPTQWTSGMVTTAGRMERTYGKFEIRAAFPAGTKPGVHSALWLWPTDSKRYGSWPASGEIDIAEFYTSLPDRVIPFVHYVSDTYDYYSTSSTCRPTNPTDFHTYGLTWTTSTMTITIDGTTCVKDTWKPSAPLRSPAPFDKPFYLNLTQALGPTNGQNALDPATTVLPATLTIDRVYVWG